MEKLNLQRDREDFYMIEVNEKGDTITFDLTDIGLPEKILKASDNIKKLDEEFKENALKLKDENLDELELTRKYIKMEKEMCLKMRKEFDSFMGDGACDKIFGDSNYYGMFWQLFDALDPHFKKMKIKSQKAKRKLVDKYLSVEKDVM